ncbi:hypothetical protein BDZ97DRAFT_1907300 [Flammula alnicola]|nr:hypothetical protein BDZ97DRAFT_1907300 [Flammula alnicola]
MPPRLSSALVACQFCGHDYSARGVKNHEARCPERPIDRAEPDPTDVAFRNFVEQERAAEDWAFDHHDDYHEADEFEAEIHPPTGLDNEQEPEMNEIRIEYHPHSLMETESFSFQEYTDSPEELEPNSAIPKDENPWRPFPTRLDFEVSEVMLDAHMNRRQIKKMIELINQAIASPNSFTLASEADHSRIWDHARDTRATGFEKRVISVEYKEEKLEYDVWLRPIWKWCRELLVDPSLIHQFQWQAQRLYKFNGQRFERFIDEPWTANAWWNYQNTLPEGASPFFIIFYADKTRLSSFGTEKGYPVLVRCANLPVSIRNGEGVGGGRLVGWLPIPEEDAQEKGKKDFVNLKREIWHKAVYEIIHSIELHTEIGTAITCGDQVIRQIFPHILIISADFEEQSMIALTRGGTSKKPCTICLVPKEEIPNLSKTFPLRTTETMREVWIRAQDMNSTDREELLKSYGLRDVKNTLWDLRGTDVYSAISWDKLHAHDGGLFSDHLLEEVKRIIKALGRDSRSAEAAIDAGLQKIPPWSGLNHFKSLASTGELADGKKFEDFSKVIIFASHHVLSEDVSEDGFLLLRLIRSYLELNMFAGLTVQTETTIAAGRAEMKVFETLLHEYAELNPEKSWTFPKAHTHQHIFRDILNKGATRNYNTKPSEKANGPLKKYYQRHTNFKNVASQVLRVSEMDLVSTIIRTAITAQDLQREADIPEDGGSESLIHEEPGSPDLLDPSNQAIPRVVQGSVQPIISFEALENSHAGDAAFQGFRRKLAGLLARRRNVQRVVLRTFDQITPYGFVKVAFTSLVDWHLNTNILRANPNFHNRPRYDYALVKVHGNECIFVQILYIFSIDHVGERYNLALVLPIDVPRMLQNRTRDEALRLRRIKPRPRASSLFIDANSIIRGGLLVDDYASDAGEFLVVDFIDEDMWMRMKSTVLLTHANI